MNQYIKPQTEITIVKAHTVMMQMSVQGNSGMKSGGAGSTSEQRVKDRDVWSDGFWE